jgi:hypothetical protein
MKRKNMIKRFLARQQFSELYGAAIVVCVGIIMSLLQQYNKNSWYLIETKTFLFLIPLSVSLGFISWAIFNLITTTLRMKIRANWVDVTLSWVLATWTFLILIGQFTITVHPLGQISGINQGIGTGLLVLGVALGHFWENEKQYHNLQHQDKRP